MTRAKHRTIFPPNRIDIIVAFDDYSIENEGTCSTQPDPSNIPACADCPCLGECRLFSVCFPTDVIINDVSEDYCLSRRTCDFGETPSEDNCQIQSGPCNVSATWTRNDPTCSDSFCSICDEDTNPTKHYCENIPSNLFTNDGRNPGVEQGAIEINGSLFDIRYYMRGHGGRNFSVGNNTYSTSGLFQQSDGVITPETLISQTAKAISQLNDAGFLGYIFIVPRHPNCSQYPNEDDSCPGSQTTRERCQEKYQELKVRRENYLQRIELFKQNLGIYSEKVLIIEPDYEYNQYSDFSDEFISAVESLRTNEDGSVSRLDFLNFNYTSGEGPSVGGGSRGHLFDASISKIYREYSSDICYEKFLEIYDQYREDVPQAAVNDCLPWFATHSGRGFGVNILFPINWGSYSYNPLFRNTGLCSGIRGCSKIFSSVRPSGYFETGGYRSTGVYDNKWFDLYRTFASHASHPANNFVSNCEVLCKQRYGKQTQDLFIVPLIDNQGTISEVKIPVRLFQEYVDYFDYDSWLNWYEDYAPGGSGYPLYSLSASWPKQGLMPLVAFTFPAENLQSWKSSTIPTQNKWVNLQEFYPDHPFVEKEKEIYPDREYSRFIFDLYENIVHYPQGTQRWAAGSDSIFEVIPDGNYIIVGQQFGYPAGNCPCWQYEPLNDLFKVSYPNRREPPYFSGVSGAPFNSPGPNFPSSFGDCRHQAPWPLYPWDGYYSNGETFAPIADIGGGNTYDCGRWLGGELLGWTGPRY